MLQEGSKAPAFKGLDQNGKTIALSSFKGQKLVLYFYPKDDTPGCTAQACNLRDNYKKLLDYFPENSKEGFKTEALPSIWENKDEFNALMQKASDDMIKLAKAIDTAEDLRAVQKDLMWNNCSACHNRFRAEH